MNNFPGDKELRVDSDTDVPLEKAENLKALASIPAKKVSMTRK